MSSSTRGISLDKLLSPLALAAGLALTGGAQAQESTPWYLGVSQGFSHDTNVFRAAGNTERGDTISSTGLLGGLNLELGRQRLFLDANASANRYRELTQLNNTSYLVNSGFNWQTVERLSGSFSATARRDLGELAIPGDPQVRNVQALHQASANVRYGLASYLGIEGGIGRRALSYAYTTEQNFSERSGHVGLRWGTPGALLGLGIAGRVTKGDAPEYRALLDPALPFLGYGPVTPDTYDRKDIDFTATWTPSALSTVSGRISLTRENHSAITRPDFSGVTGSVAWDYRPTGRLDVKTSLSRDTGSQSVFFTSLETLFVPVEANTNQITTVLNVNARYELTGKIVLTGSVAYADGAVADATGRTGNNSSSKYALGAHYQATRAISLGCSLSHVGEHHNVAGCTAQFVIR